MSLIKTLYPLLSTGLTHEDRTLSRHDWKTVNWGIKHKRICDNPSENRTGIPTGSHRDPTGILNPGGIPPGY